MLCFVGYITWNFCYLRVTLFLLEKEDVKYASVCLSACFVARLPLLNYDIESNKEHTLTTSFSSNLKVFSNFLIKVCLLVSFGMLVYLRRV